MSDLHTLTTIMPTYYRPAFLKQAVDALFRQTYDKLEIILVNNGATPETIEYLHEIEASDRRVKLVNFQENQFSWDDPMKMNDVCLNAALKVATGDYVFYQQDDDLIADDYTEKMVALFKGNPDCTSAAGLPVSIDAEGNIRNMGPRRSNLRPRYMPGHRLVVELVRGERSLFSAPGTIFTFKRDVLVRAGGYHRVTEISQLYGIVPFGITGFDESAFFYWRHHGGQLNRQMSARGLVGIDETFALLKDWEIERRWQVFGPKLAREVVSYVEKQTYDRAAYWFVVLACTARFRGSLRVLSRIWRRRHFWLRAAIQAKRNWRLLPLVRWGIGPVMRRLFRLRPSLARQSPKLARIKERVER